MPEVVRIRPGDESLPQFQCPQSCPRESVAQPTVLRNPQRDRRREEISPTPARARLCIRNRCGRDRVPGSGLCRVVRRSGEASVKLDSIPVAEPLTTRRCPLKCAQNPPPRRQVLWPSPLKRPHLAMRPRTETAGKPSLQHSDGKTTRIRPHFVWHRGGAGAVLAP
jgi:hypothetical protein